MPLKLVPDNTNIGFVRMRYVAFVVTILLTLGSIGLLMSRGLHPGGDFVGGLTMGVELKAPPHLDARRTRGVGRGVAAPPSSVRRTGAGVLSGWRTPLPWACARPAASLQAIQTIAST